MCNIEHGVAEGELSLTTYCTHTKEICYLNVSLILMNMIFFNPQSLSVFEEPVKFQPQVSNALGSRMVLRVSHPNSMKAHSVVRIYLMK